MKLWRKKVKWPRVQSATRVYAENYPNRRHPNKRSLEKLLQPSRRTGSVLQ